MRPFQYISLVFFLLMAILLYSVQRYVIASWYLVVPVVIYIHLLVLGAINIRWDFFLRSYHRGRDKTQIALTFDDGPASETMAILNILRDEGVPAAFFTIGKNAAAYTALVKRWDEEGHLIGNHSYDHGFNFDWKSAQRMADELNATNHLIRNITGKTPLLFRPPYGVTNPNVAKAVSLTGMKSIGWSIRSFDTTAKDEEQLLQRVLGQLKGGDIILLHDSMGITRSILTRLIKAAREKGFTFVRVDQLLQLQPYV